MQDDTSPENNEIIEPTESAPVVEELKPEENIASEVISEQTPETTTLPEVPPVVPVETPEPVKKRRVSKKQLFLIGGLIVLIIVAVLGYFLLKPAKKAVAPAKQSSSKEEPKTIETANDTVINGNTYYAEPREVKDLIIYKSDTCTTNDQYCKNGKIDGVFAYTVGQTADKKDILAYRSGGGIDSIDFVFVKNGETYELINTNKISDLSSYSKDTLVKVSVTPTTKLPELTGDVNPTIKGQKLEGDGVPSFAFTKYDDKGKLVLVKTTPGEKLAEQNNKTYYVTSADKGNYYSKSVVAQIGNVFQYRYKLSGEITGTGSTAAQNIKWKSGDAKGGGYHSGGAGCGTANNYSAAKATKADLVQTGTTPGGQPVYSLVDTSPLLKEIFDTDYNKGESAEDASLKNLTLAQFNDKHAYFIIENQYGDFVVMLSDTLFIQGGCGKPVVYLYPERDTNVSVKVGANVTISEPTYPEGGWKNVLARPNGQLTYNEKNYGSLFWEGQGHGAYPEITQGTIVKKADAVKTMRDQLTLQGINKHESDEFIAFWGPNLPNKPYIRLTWFTSSQLATLAPLSVTPRPNTTIRVFLDFEGLDKPTKLAKQSFPPAPARRGFTVVEWGGLARNGLKNLVH